ncbi:MAG: hypothetical protein ACREP9_06830 [Candidatus Dormibacteraceae bacterium]
MRPKLRVTSQFGLICLLLPLIATLACQPASPTPCRPTPSNSRGKLLMLQADPNTAGVSVILLDGKLPTAGHTTSLRWVVDSRRAGPSLMLIAGQQNGTQSFQTTIREEHSSGMLTTFDSSLNFPAIGCWPTEVQSGSAEGTVTFDITN